MNMTALKKTAASAAVCAGFCLYLFASSSSAFAGEVLKGSIFPLPGLIESADKGLFIDVLKEIESCLPAGTTVTRELFPPARAMNNVLEAEPSADFVFPGIANPLPEIESPLNYTLPYGKVTFVIYSNKSKPVTLKDLLSHKGKPKEKYPYVVETFPSALSYFPFPLKAFACVDCALKKVISGHSDAVIMAMDEIDAEIKRQKITSLYREFYADFDAVAVTPKTARGLKVKAILDEATRCALKKGRIQKIYFKVHRPFIDWQPY